MSREKSCDHLPILTCGANTPKRARGAQKGLRPSPRFDVCPPLRALSAHWGVAYFLEELYWKRSHFSGLEEGFGQAEHLALDRDLSPKIVAEWILAGIDPIEEILRLVADAARLEGRPDLRRSWQLSETTLNARLCLGVACLTHQALALLWSQFLPWDVHSGQLSVAQVGGWLDGKRPDGEFGQPDLLLINERQLVMIEMKVRGKATANAKYDPDQLLKYLNLADWTLANTSMDQVCHLIATPRGGSDPFVRRKEWVSSEDTKTGALRIRIDGLPLAVRKGKWKDRLAESGQGAKLERLLSVVPIHHVRYDALVSASLELRDSDPWSQVALRQFARLREDAEPQGP